MTSNIIPTNKRERHGGRAPGNGWTSKLLVTAIAIIGIASATRYFVDEQVRQDPICADQQPGLRYRADTLAAIAQQCVGDAKLQRARTLAIAALKRQPASQAALAALGSIAELRGDVRQADGWFTRASLLGHRDYFTETYWINRFADLHDPRREAGHIDAVLRAGWTADLVLEQARQLERSAAGRDALRGVMTVTSPWALPYLRNVAMLSPEGLSNRSLMLAALARDRATASVFDASVAVPTVNALYKGGRIEEALAVRASFRPFDANAIVNNPGFRATPVALRSPFDWTFHHDAGLDLLQGEGASSRAGFEVRASDPGRYMIAEQTVRLPPGSYRVELARSDAPAPGTTFLVTLRGVEHDEQVVPVKLSEPTPGQPNVGDFSTAGQDRFFKLALWLDVEDGASPPDIAVTSLTVRKR